MSVRVAIRKVRSAAWRIGRVVHNARRALSSLGWSAGATYIRMRWREYLAPPKGRDYPLSVPGVAWPITLRGGTSDIEVFHQVFVEDEYGPLADLGCLTTIVDCGANVGFSATYLLARHPDATLLAVEPDPGNFAALRRNLVPFGDRVRASNAAVWSHSCGLVLCREGFRDHREWSVHVREAVDGEVPDVEALGLAELLDSFGERRIDLLKMDVERAEVAIFSSGVDRWLDRVDNIVIELHDDECERVFHEAIRAQGGSVSRHADLTIWRRTAPGSSR